MFEISQPRTPCFKQARKLGVPDFVKLILQTGKPGFLARVLQPGAIAVGDAFELVERPHPEANLVFVNRAMYDDDASAARELALLAPLADDWRAKFARAGGECKAVDLFLMKRTETSYLGADAHQQHLGAKQRALHHHHESLRNLAIHKRHPGVIRQSCGSARAQSARNA